MAQNRSSAVMQQRSEPHDSLDDFPPCRKRLERAEDYAPRELPEAA